jgi:hypothetical protein
VDGVMRTATELLNLALRRLESYEEECGANVVDMEVMKEIRIFLDSEPEADLVYVNTPPSMVYPEFNRNKWQGLTDEEIWQISNLNGDDYEYYRAIEKALKEKNNG